MSKPPDWMVEPLSWIGLPWPDGDPTRLGAMGDAWLEFSREMQALHFNATTAAEKVWSSNSGEAIDTFKLWWNGPEGPGTVMASAADSAEKMGTASRAMSTGVTILQANFVSALAGLGAAALIGAAVGGAGAFVTTPAAAGIAAAALRVAIGVLIGLVAGYIIGQLLDGTSWEELFDKVKTMPTPVAVPFPTPIPRPHEEPSPQASPVYPPPHPPDTRDRDGRCQIPPTIAQTPNFAGDTAILNKDWVGTGVWSVAGLRNQDSSHTISTLGFIRDDIGRQNLEYRMQEYRKQIGLGSTWPYDAAHAWPGRFGTELGADIKFSPLEFNRGPQVRLENWIVDQHETLSRNNGWVELRTMTNTHPANVWTFNTLDQNGYRVTREAGQRFLSGITYDVALCRPGRLPETHVFQAEVGPPSPAGAPYRLSPNWPQ